MSAQQPGTSPSRRGISGPQVLLVVLITVLATAAVSYWLLGRYVFPQAFTPVQLRAGEEQDLSDKLQLIGVHVGEFDREGRLRPQPYSEQDARREVAFTERELNALLATNTELADRVAIDLSDDLISILALVPVEEDFPVLGGRTLRVHAGVEFSYRDGRPVVMLTGVSLMGVPVPSAWLGNLKNVDLVQEFGADPGFWQAFAEGVEHIEVRNGELNLRLRE